jgi:hypothetical protein
MRACHTLIGSLRAEACRSAITPFFAGAAPAGLLFATLRQRGRAGLRHWGAGKARSGRSAPCVEMNPLSFRISCQGVDSV